MVRGGPHAGADRRVMARRAAKMLRHLGRDEVELSVALVDDGFIRELNRSYRGLDRPTDVLAFAMGEGQSLPAAADEPELLGDVVISVPTARRQARQRGRALLDELTTLLAHGLLHLLGYQHADRRQQRTMAALTAELERAASAPLRSGQKESL